jgi:pimeloyl-ACP methyl ester carboxylesterase
MKIVFVHGRSQQGKDEQELRFLWEDALSKGFAAAGLAWPANVEFVFPFYGDRLDRLLAEVDSPLIGNVLSRGGTAVSAEGQFRGDILAEMIRGFPGLEESRIADQFTGQPAERGPQNWKWVLAMLRVLDKTPIGSHAVDLFTRDVFVYLTYPGVRKQIDAIVAAALNAGPCIVVAHSLGTVIAYNILVKRPAAAGEIPLLVTVGSPLGIEAVRTRVEAPLRMPPQVKRWVNALDTRDVVALYPLNADHFNIAPPIENNVNIFNRTDNRHGIEGYLDDATVAERINSALLNGPRQATPGA